MVDPSIQKGILTRDDPCIHSVVRAVRNHGDEKDAVSVGPAQFLLFLLWFKTFARRAICPKNL